MSYVYPAYVILPTNPSYTVLLRKYKNRYLVIYCTNKKV